MPGLTEMSNNEQWETVTKSKKLKNFERKVIMRQERKREEALQPKLEQILPFHKLRPLLTGVPISPSLPKDTSSKSNSCTPKKTPKPAKDHQHSSSETKKSKQDMQNAKQQHKPKSLEQAFKALTPDDFNSHLMQYKIWYPDSRLSWLKAAAGYANLHLQFECDPTFMEKPTSYPSNLASPALKKAIVEFLTSQGETNLEYFFHYTLMESMCTNMNNNIPVVGYKFILQLIAQNWPHICSSSMASTAMLRHSYQNRSNICLSILWAVGQGGYQNLMVGLKVWQNLMLPNLEMRSYCRFISEYIEKILLVAVDQSLSFNQNEFFAIYNALKCHYPSLPRDCQDSLKRSCEMFLLKYIANTGKHANLFLTLLRDIEHPTRNRMEIDACLSCLLHGGNDCFKVWKMNYKKQVLPSIYLLQKIEKEIFDSASSLASFAPFHDFLLEAAKLNSDLNAAKRRDPNVDTLIHQLKNVQEKTAQQKKKQACENKKGCGCCKWTLGCLVLIALIAGALIYDTEVNGKGVFAKSATGKVLQNAGLLPHVEKAWYTSMSTAARGYKWAEKTLPPYTKPVCTLICDLTKVARNGACTIFSAAKDYANAKLPVAAQFLEQYVPGLPKKIEDTTVTVKSASSDYYGKVVAFFQTQVLVGRFSPENLSKALNQTQNMALDYYNQFHKKVDAYAKLK